MDILELAKYKIIKYSNTPYFNKLKEITIKFGKDNNILIIEEGNKYLIYSNKPMKYSNDLANLLYNELDNHIILYTHLPNKEFVIQVDSVNIISFFLSINSLEYQDNLKMIFEYKQLYNINNFYSDIIESDNINNIDIINKYIEPEIKITTKYKVLKYFYENNDLDIVLLDYYAIPNKIINFNKTMNFIIDLDIKIIKRILEKIIKKLNIKAKINIISNDSYYIPHDFRLKKFTISINFNNMKIYLMNIYNSIQYELLPITTNINKFLIPHRTVLLRFLSIDLYFNLLFNKNKNNIYLDEIIYMIQIINKFDDSRENCNWVGIYRDEGNDKILETKNNEKQYYPYYPQKYFNFNNNLRFIK